jgi:hypothetical protein
MTKTQTVDLLRSQLPGFYSVEQVINLIEKMEDTPKITQEHIKAIAQSITAEIESEAQKGHIVSKDEVEFDLNGREIEVADVPINFDTIRECIEEGLSNAFEEEE